LQVNVFNIYDMNDVTM